jgi:hypothetical protein
MGDATVEAGLDLMPAIARIKPRLTYFSLITMPSR